MDTAGFFIRNRLISWLTIVIAMAWGTMAYFQMPRFEDPEFLIRTAQIITEYPGASPLEVANEVGDPIESELQGMQEVKEIRATTFYGFSVIEVDIKHEFSSNREELQLIWTRLRGKVSDAARQLPPGASQPLVYDDYGDVFGLFYLITGSGFSNLELYDYADALRKRIVAIDGIAKVDILGKQQEAIFVELPKARQAALGADAASIFDSLQGQNAVLSAGSALAEDRRLPIYPLGQIGTIEEIENVMVPVGFARDLVRLGDLAFVSRGFVEPAQAIAYYNGEPAIALGIANASGSNIAKIGDKVRKLLAQTKSERPNGIEIHEFYHQGDVVNEAVDNFVVNVVLALLIVIITLMIFMGYRSALIIGAILTITIASTLATMQIVDIPMHRISLGALIIALGMLVDNAIVVTDGILIGTRNGKGVIQSARDVVGKTRWALLGGTIVGIIAFAPIGFAPGDTAEYTNHLFWVIFISLTFSWIYAITLAPMLANLAFTTSSERAKEGQSKAIKLYENFLDRVLHARLAMILASIGLLGTSIWGYQFVEEGFFPTATTPQIAIDYWLPESTDITRTNKDAAAIYEELSGYKEIEAVHTIVGSGTLRYMLIYTPQIPNGAYAQLILKMRDIQDIPNLIPKIQSYIDENYPSAQARVWRFRLGPGQGPKVEATFTGPDPGELRRLSAQAKSIFDRESTASGVQTSWRNTAPVIELNYDPFRGGRTGVSRENFVSALNFNFIGQAIGVFREDDELLPIIARAPESEREGITEIGNIQVVSRLSGESLPLSEQMSSVGVNWRDTQLIRQDRIWTLKVQADPIDGVLASTLLERVRDKIESIELPNGYELRWDGEYGDSVKANAELAQTLPMGLLAMVLSVILLFNAIKQAAVIWLTVPLAVIGVVLGLYMTNTPMEFMGLLGLLSLSGLLIKNAIVLVDQMDQEIADAKPRYEAVISSAASRVRPVCMGAATTVLGVLPLFGDVFFRSMAVVIVFGLTFATILTLIVVPVIYSLFFNITPDEVHRK